MALRQARLIAFLLLATIVALALASALWLGPAAHHTALFAVGHAVVLSAVFEGAARVPRWRRNVVRAGSTFATAWVGALALVVLTLLIDWAGAIGRPVAREPALACAVAILVLIKANFLPKSRPAWFNGTTLPIFAADPAVWRKVHRASAWRLVAIGIAILIAAACAPVAMLRPLATGLLLAELALATLHGLLLGYRADKGSLR